MMLLLMMMILPRGRMAYDHDHHDDGLVLGGLEHCSYIKPCLHFIKPYHFYYREGALFSAGAAITRTDFFIWSNWELKKVGCTTTTSTRRNVCMCVCGCAFFLHLPPFFSLALLLIEFIIFIRNSTTLPQPTK